MAATMGNAKRARELQRLFEEWRRAFDAQDRAAMQRARQAIDDVAIRHQETASRIKVSKSP
jgi:hypothetical protein